MKTILYVVIGIAIGAALAYTVDNGPTLGSASPGLAATVATSTQAAVTGTASTVFATSTNCAARTIGTAGASIMITFTDKNGQTPSATNGFIQATNTTVVYDCGLFGNGAVKVYSGTSQTITVQETR